MNSIIDNLNTYYSDVQLLNEYESRKGDVAQNLEIIKKAIKDASNLEFEYGYHKRFVEPFTVGTHKVSGNKVMAAYHVYGFSYSQNKPQWRLYRLDKMSDVKIREMVQRRNRPLYNPDDSRMSFIDATMADFYTTKGDDNFTLEKLKQYIKDKFDINTDTPEFMNTLKNSISKMLKK